MLHAQFSNGLIDASTVVVSAADLCRTFPQRSDQDRQVLEIDIRHVGLHTLQHFAERSRFGIRVVYNLISVVYCLIYWLIFIITAA